ncbi:cell division protein FtsQ [Methylocella silvestris]|uniref:Cell division protein FtsQ n=2 Tax=Methylocella silvestris TaxID=199596 RepID=A0A2J7TLC3_METSI|nr:FtsQ-type POTRA domain-containing protein [Methylocella silvestris]PNG27572.1 cell division protein FtsQ [Methylocella silvestris]
MDGRRRFLRSLGARQGEFAQMAPFGAALKAPAAVRRAPTAKPRARRPRPGARHRLLARLSGSGATFVFVAALFAATGVYGAVRGGHYQTMIEAYGEPADIMARALGFRIKAVTIAGQNELTEAEILAAAGVGERNSLPFLDVAKVRERLRAIPLVKEVSVAKLYPNRLLIEIEERQPAALWQKDGTVHIVATDGMTIDDLRDQRFANLPLVVGDDANMKLDDYRAILEAAGSLRERIRAGVFVSGRRWNLKMNDGVDVLLPETAPAAAVETLVRLQRESRVLDKAVLSIDLRQPGRMTARLTEEASAERVAAAAAHKPKSKGGQI